MDYRYPLRVVYQKHNVRKKNYFEIIFVDMGVPWMLHDMWLHIILRPKVWGSFLKYSSKSIKMHNVSNNFIIIFKNI